MNNPFNPRKSVRVERNGSSGKENKTTISGGEKDKVNNSLILNVNTNANVNALISGKAANIKNAELPDKMVQQPKTEKLKLGKKVPPHLNSYLLNSNNTSSVIDNRELEKKLKSKTTKSVDNSKSNLKRRINIQKESEEVKEKIMFEINNYRNSKYI